MKRDSLHLTGYQFTCLNVDKVLGLSPSGLQERLSVRWKSGIRAAELSCQVCQWWTTQVGMRLVPPLLYWSSGSGQWSKVSTVLKPSRKWIRGGQGPKVGVKAWLLLGRAFGRPPAMSPLTWAGAQGLAGQKVSLAPTHWWQYHVEGSFQFSWSSSYLGTSATNSSQANQQTRHSGQAVVSMFTVGQNLPMLELRALLWLVGCATRYLPFSPGVPHFCCPKFQRWKTKAPAHHIVLLCLGHDSEGGFFTC